MKSIIAYLAFGAAIVFPINWCLDVIESKQESADASVQVIDSAGETIWVVAKLDRRGSSRCIYHRFRRDDGLLSIAANSLSSQVLPGMVREAEEHTTIVVEEEAGWPCTALSGYLTISGAEAVTQSHWALQMSKSDINAFGDQILLPLKPVWPGFFIHALVGSVMTMLVHRGFIVTRGIRRRMHQQCPSCGYPVRSVSSGCPECGWNRPGDES